MYQLWNQVGNQSENFVWILDCPITSHKIHDSLANESAPLKPPATEDEPERRTSFKDLSLDSETTNTLRSVLRALKSVWLAQNTSLWLVNWSIQHKTEKRQIDTKPKLISSVPPPSIPLNPVPSPSILKKSIPKPDPKPENFGQASYEIGSKFDTGFGSVEYVSPISFKPYKGIILKITWPLNTVWITVR